MLKLDQLKEKVKEMKEKVKEKSIDVLERTGKFLDEHPHMISTVFTVGAGVTAGIISGVANIGKEKDDRCWVSDDVTELEFHTKHPLNNTEILELGERMIDGQTKGDALNEMGLLKKEKKRR